MVIEESVGGLEEVEARKERRMVWSGGERVVRTNSHANRFQWLRIGGSFSTSYQPFRITCHAYFYFFHISATIA